MHYVASICECVSFNIYVHIDLGKLCLFISWRPVRGLSSSISSINIDTLNEISYFINITAKKKWTLCSSCKNCSALRAKSHISCTWYQAISAFVYPSLSNIIPLPAEKRSFLINMRISKSCCQIEIINNLSTWLPPFWRASTSCEVNFAMETDFTRWVNSRLYNTKNINSLRENNFGICLHAKFNINQQKKNKFLCPTALWRKYQSAYIIDHEGKKSIATEGPITEVTETGLYTKLQEIFSKLQQIIGH